jgi:TonB-dependent siderophore receptor
LNITLEKGRRGLGVLFLASAAVLPAVMLATPVAAQSGSQRSFNIEAQNLDRALAIFGAQSGLQVTVNGAQIRGVKSRGASGTMSREQALSALLTGTGFTYRYAGANTVLIERAPDIADGTISLGPVRVEGANGSGGLVASASSDMLASEGTGSYTPRGSVTSSKLPLTLRETPQSVTVITRQQIEDRNFITIDEAIESSTGVTAEAFNLGTLQFKSRGFDMGSGQIDGMMGAGGSTGGYVPNIAMFDRIEVMRGAAGLVAGRGYPGGVVNLIRKRPLDKARYGLVLHAGTWDQYRGEADISVPVTDWLRVRAVASYENRKFFTDLVHTKRPMIYGVAEADVTPTTLLTVGASYEENNTDSFFNSGLPWFSNGKDSRLPRSSRGIAPGWNYFDVNATNIFGSVEQRLGGAWKAKVQVNQQRWSQDYLAPNARPSAIDPVTLIGPQLRSTVQNFRATTETLSFEGQIDGEVQALGRTHEIAVGASYSRQKDFDNESKSATIDATPRPIFNADPWAVARPVFGEFSPTGYSAKIVQEGIWGVARLNVADPLKVILGARLSNYESGAQYTVTGPFTTLKQKHVFTPYGGVVFDVARNWSVYASYAEIFRDQNSMFRADGSTLPPVTGVNYELGTKGEFYDGKLNVSFALFRVVESNRAQQDPNNPAPCVGAPTADACYIADGKVRGQGFEAEVSGEVLPGFEITAGYTFTDTEYLRDRTDTGAPSENQGADFSSITPKHLLRVWGNYKLSGALEGVSVGAGVNAQSRISSSSDGTDTVEQKAYALVNARLGYQVNEHVSLALIANNLFDKRYYQRLYALNGGNRYGEPRSVLVNARITY